jgi:hypothetical protein
MSAWLVALGLILLALVLWFALRRDHAVTVTMKLLGVVLHVETKHREGGRNHRAT